MTDKESSAPADPRAHVPRMTVEPRPAGSRVVAAPEESTAVEDVAAVVEPAPAEAKATKKERGNAG